MIIAYLIAIAIPLTQKDYIQQFETISTQIWKKSSEDDASIISSEDDDIPIVAVLFHDVYTAAPLDFIHFLHQKEYNWYVKEVILFIFFLGLLQHIFRLSLRHSTFITNLYKDKNTLMNGNVINRVTSIFYSG
jgi:hypothetical protein